MAGAPIGPMGKPVVDNKKAEELAALYARAMRTVADMEALPGLDEDPAEQALLSARRDFLAAFRNRYCATVYFNQAKVRAASSMLVFMIAHMLTCGVCVCVCVCVCVLTFSGPTRWR